MESALVPVAAVEQAITVIRGQNVMLDRDLAELYDVRTSDLNKAVKRNLNRFPSDFMFRLTADEASALRFQFATLKPGRGQHSKYLPYAFTEQGVVMLSSVLRSERAVEVNITIMRTFVRMREMIISHKELARRLNDLETKYDAQFRVVFEAIRQLMAPPPEPTPKRRIGFHAG